MSEAESKQIFQLSKSSISNDKMLIRALFRFAMERDMIGKDYSEYVQLPSVETKFEKGTFSDPQIKTEAGRNRIVPVHPKIKPYLTRWLEKGGDTIICEDPGRPISAPRYRAVLFEPVVKALGIPQATPQRRNKQILNGS